MYTANAWASLPGERATLRSSLVRVAAPLLTVMTLAATITFVTPGSAGASPTTTAPPLQGPDVAAQTKNAADEVSGLETTVDGWGVNCDTTGEVDQQLAFAQDALDQGNLLGARALLQVSMANVNDESRDGLLARKDKTKFDATAGKILRAVPMAGHVPNEFAGTSPVSMPADPSCPNLAASFSLSSGGPSLSETLRILLKTGVEVGTHLGEVPVVGVLLGGLIELLWPSEAPSWDEIQSYVEKQVNQAIDLVTKAKLQADLTGLKAVLDNYVAAVQTTEQPWSVTDKAYIESNFVTSLDLLEHDLPEFGAGVPARPYLVLPEYTQIMNLLLLQLRDGIVHGASFGVPSGAIGTFKTKMATYIKNGNDWVATHLPDAYKALPHPPDFHVDPTKPCNFTAFIPGAGLGQSNVNAFNQKVCLDQTLLPAVSDQTFYWPYLDPVKYPDPIHPKDTRVLYSEVYGSMDNNGTPSVSGADKAALTHITVWGSDTTNGLDALQLTYGLGTNPEPRTGDASGGKSTPPVGGSFAVGPSADSRGDITQVYGRAGTVPGNLGFIFAKGATTTNSGKMGAQGDIPNYTVQFPDEVLGYAKVLSVSSFYHRGGGVVFGFRLADSY